MNQPLIICSVSPCDELAIEYVRKWCREKGYTADDVDIRKDERAVWAQFKPESTYE